jgi:hypothetical protein
MRPIMDTFASVRASDQPVKPKRLLAVKPSWPGSVGNPACQPSRSDRSADAGLDSDGVAGDSPGDGSSATDGLLTHVHLRHAVRDREPDTDRRFDWPTRRVRAESAGAGSPARRSPTDPAWKPHCSRS